MNTPKAPGKSEMNEYYKGQSIFITGGSGFMGKVLVEKLLYSCSDIKEIFILMRPKRGRVPESRLEDMFKLPMFQRIREEKPEVLKKLVPVQGDVTFDGLGLSGDTLERVVKNTSIVFHMAATLRLEAKLKDAIDMNTTGTKRVLDLCRKMSNLRVIVHLSTAFCYCDKEVLHEKVYECPHNPHDLMRCAEWMDEKMMDNITPNLITPHPNTYTYSKRLAEILVRNEYPNLPVVIARPSIVIPANEEPLPGWVDSLNGPIGLMIGGAKGVIRSMLCNGEYRAEVIPVDIAINGLLTIAYTEGQAAFKRKDIPVYNITCTEGKKVTWGEVLELGKKVAYEYPFEAGVWYPNGTITTNKIVHTLSVILFHWIPAYLIDFLMFLFGQKRFMVRVQTRISDGLEVLQFFTTRKWDFRSENFQGLPGKLNALDERTFTMDMDTVENVEYLKKVILGGRQYCLKEPLTSLPKARMQLKALYVLDLTTKIVLGGLLLWKLLSVLNLIEPLFSLFEKKEISILAD
ncbi:putative fatty acyl-CoA reductase CG5065 [Phlebotomus argentipes]|uniref:putative fatty acyl-CoA reductase CG5065 n=1 Tax=Phlebotomus argentipes TaxID=94469 RepID=UPI0028929CF3|nr:putative fatty acyl-CoA reductase CG5065 [Phlebotomus argentipes]